MATLSDVNLNVINFKDPLRAKQHRENYSDIQTAVNAINAAINALSSSTSTSEIISARDAQDTLQDRLHQNEKLFGNGVISLVRTINACDATTEWDAGSNASLSLDTSTYIEGTGSISFSKTGTASEVTYTADVPSKNLKNKFIRFYLYIKDTTTLNLFSGSGTIYARITPDNNFATNYKQWDLETQHTLAVGWNTVTLSCDTPDHTTGAVNDDDDILKFQIAVTTDTSSDTFSSAINIDSLDFYGAELKVKAETTPDMSVVISAGQGIVDGHAVYKDSDTNSSTITAPTGNPRYDIVTIDKNNDIYIYNGVEAASPAIPPTPANQIKLANIYHRVGSTSIKNSDDSTNSYIADTRTILTGAQSLGSVQVAGGNVMGSFSLVSPDGDAPYTAIQDAIDNCVSSYSGDGVILVGKGAYTETLDFTGFTGAIIYMSGVTVNGGAPYMSETSSGTTYIDADKIVFGGDFAAEGNFDSATFDGTISIIGSGNLELGGSTQGDVALGTNGELALGANGELRMNGSKVTPVATLHGNKNENEIFDFFNSNLTLATNDKFIVWGVIGDTAGANDELISLSYAEKTSSTAIELYGVKLVSGGAVSKTSVSVTDGVTATSYAISVAI